MANDLVSAAPTDSNGSPFVGAVSPTVGTLRPLEGGTETSITGSPTANKSIRLVVESKDGGFASLGAQADSAYAGSGSASLLAISKGVFANTQHLYPATANTACTVTSNHTVAATDTNATFATAVNHWCMQNNTTANVYYNLDAAASLATFILPPGAMVFWDWPVTIVHLYTVAQQNVNASTNPIVLIGRV